MFPRLIALLLAVMAWPAQAQDASDYERERGAMAALIDFEILLSSGETGITELDPRIREALRAVPRHEFVPEPLRPYAYSDSPLPVGYDQNISAPFIVALMVQLAAPQASETVFETGTGAGYMAALLSRLAARVYSVEVVEELAAEAALKLKELGYDNVTTAQGDGYYGWPEHAPYDAIIVKEAIDHVPPPLLGQLKPGGRMVIPIGPARGPQMLTVVHKGTEGQISKTSIMEVIFSPLQGGERT